MRQLQKHVSPGGRVLWTQHGHTRNLAILEDLGWLGRMPPSKKEGPAVGQKSCNSQGSELAGWVAGWAGWLVGWLVGWLAGWLGWLAKQAG